MKKEIHEPTRKESIIAPITLTPDANKQDKTTMVQTTEHREASVNNNSLFKNKRKITIGTIKSLDNKVIQKVSSNVTVHKGSALTTTIYPALEALCISAGLIIDAQWPSHIIDQIGIFLLS